ncbi:hypothetical protein GFO_2627 [Christiangramia forsetii KT0803]|uniref:Uncharacterized protein n=2 Tax=Christiangramia forsetii TaxID=411153 RepID=A0M4N8_CHRFK|nr:hypothetical protein GCM10011532_02630 [Christiangramia forsetii]CAL67583.1 hypothetical protein GFO_2627 [Christiangramia forsetii KT0803]
MILRLILPIATGFVQDQIQQKLKMKNIKPSSKIAIDKRLKELRKEFRANTNKHLIGIMKDLKLI